MRQTKEKMVADVGDSSGINKKTSIPLLTFVGHQSAKLISGFPDDTTSVAHQQHTLAAFFVVVCFSSSLQQR